MTNENKSPMFGHSVVFDQATYEPRSGKSALMNELMAELAGKQEALGTTPIGSTRKMQLKINFDGHTTIYGPTRNGMSAMPDTLRDQYAKAGGAAQVDAGSASVIRWPPIGQLSRANCERVRQRCRARR